MTRFGPIQHRIGNVYAARPPFGESSSAERRRHSKDSITGANDQATFTLPFPPSFLASLCFQSSFTSTLERRLIWLWPVFWAFSMVVNGFGWGFVGFSYAGGYCYFSPEEGKLFTPLLQFVPR